MRNADRTQVAIVGAGVPAANAAFAIAIAMRVLAHLDASAGR
jgi:hypothetical protein